MGKVRTGGRRLAMNQLCASLSLFVSERFELPELQGPVQLMFEDSILKSASTRACQAGSDKTSLLLCAHNLKWF